MTNEAYSHLQRAISEVLARKLKVGVPLLVINSCSQAILDELHHGRYADWLLELQQVSAQQAASNRGGAGVTLA